MSAEMEGLFLPEPTLTSDRRAFRVVLRNTPTLSIEDREWVASLGSEDQSSQEFRALLDAHRHGRVDNARLRDLTGLDTLSASRLLGRLRDRGLLVLHGGGAASYYTLVGRDGAQPVDRNESRADRRESDTDRSDLAADRSNLRADRSDSAAASVGERPDLAELSQTLRAAISALGMRPRRERLWPVIADLCAIKARRPAELTKLLSFASPNTLAFRHLGPMVEAGILERTHPETPNHPDQAYRVRGETPSDPASEG